MLDVRTWHVLVIVFVHLSRKFVPITETTSASEHRAPAVRTLLSQLPAARKLAALENASEDTESEGGFATSTSGSSGGTNDVLVALLKRDMVVVSTKAAKEPRPPVTAH